MGEILLAIVALLLLFSNLMFSNVKFKYLFEFKVLVGIALLVMIWFFNDSGKIPFKVIISVVVLTSLYRTYLARK